MTDINKNLSIATATATAHPDYFLMTEITKNPDGYRDSIYLSKDKGE